jgi:undecaprenyl-diphosphatase
MSFQSLDYQITTFINTLIPHNAFFDFIFRFLSFDGSSVIIWLVIGLFIAWYEKHEDIRMIVALIITLAITFLMVNYVLKNIFQRPRPYVTYHLVAPHCPKDFSFPSGHAALAFAAASILVIHDRKRHYIYLIIAAFIALSRVYLNCHYFFDIIGGGLTGTLISALVLRSNIAYKIPLPKR